MTMIKTSENEGVVYALFTCDEWRSFDSMRLVAVFQDESTLANYVRMNHGELGAESKCELCMDDITYEEIEQQHVDFIYVDEVAMYC